MSYASFPVRPDQFMKLKVKPDAGAIPQNTLCQKAWGQGSESRGKQDAGSGEIHRKPCQCIQGEYVIGSGFNNEFDLVTGGDPPKIVRIIVRVHPARRAFDVHDTDAAAVNPGNIEASIGFH